MAETKTTGASKSRFIIRSKDVVKLPHGLVLVPTGGTDDPVKAQECRDQGLEVIDTAASES
ncbi:MAG TPA: hypothetical protein VGG19_12250 [Tepidisphaeraceae bacterium]|jgi:hypothetical protein